MKFAVATAFVFALGMAPGLKAYNGPPPPDPAPLKPDTSHKSSHRELASAPQRRRSAQSL